MGSDAAAMGTIYNRWLFTVRLTNVYIVPDDDVLAMEVDVTNNGPDNDVDVGQVTSEEDSDDLPTALDLEFEEQAGLDYQLEEMAWMTEDESADTDISGSCG